MTPIGEIVVINDFASASGGATVIALLAAQQYRRLGYKVTYICGDSPTPQLAALGVTQIALNSAGLLELPAGRAAMQGLHNHHAARTIMQWIRENDTDRTVYHLHNWSQILSPAVFQALRKVEERVVVTCHDFFNICPNGGFSHYQNSASCSLRPLSPKCLLSQCDRRNGLQKYWRALRHAHLNRQARFGKSRSTFTFLHEGMQEKFVRSGFAARDLISIPNPVEAWSTERITAERNAGFLFVGRIGRDKGADLAIEAARAAGQKITLAGIGELTASSSADNPDVKFAGWCSQSEIADIAAHARALIVPSRVIEPFGLVILEAAMSGLPVIISSHGYLARDVAQQGFGNTFNIGERDGLTEIVKKFSSNDGLIEQMSKAGFARAASLRHTPESWTSKFIEIFERKLNQLHPGKESQPA